MAQFSSSKGLDCLGLLTSFKTLLLKDKGFFVQFAPLKRGISLLEGDCGSDIYPGSRASSQPSQAVSKTLSQLSRAELVC